MSSASTRLTVGCLAVLVVSVLAGGSRREKTCSLADQCPEGDSCTYLTTNRIPRCDPKMEKANLVLRCEVDAIGGRRTAVYCPPDAK